jgi:hypothetical protein
MPRSSLPWLVLGAIAVSALLAWLTLTRGGAQPGRAPPVEHHELAAFHEIAIAGSADVVLVQGDAEAIDVDVDGRSAVVEATVSKGRLRISAQDRRRWWNRMFGRSVAQSPTITVHLRNLDVLVLAGNANVTIPKLEAQTLRVSASGGTSLTVNDLRATTLRVSGSGALNATLAGTVDDEHVSISGAGTYRAERLRAADAFVSVSGVGNVVVHAERKLRASISGAGLIEYVGDPQVSQSVSGLGKVRRHESATPGIRVAGGQCTGGGGAVPASLNSSGPPVIGSMSACTPPTYRTSWTRQSRNKPASVAATSCTDSYA